MKTTTRRGANHGLHLVLTVMTCGIWAVTGWPIAAIIGRRKTVTTLMDGYTCVGCRYRGLPNHAPGRCPGDY